MSNIEEKIIYPCFDEFGRTNTGALRLLATLIILCWIGVLLTILYAMAYLASEDNAKVWEIWVGCGFLLFVGFGIPTVFAFLLKFCLWIIDGFKQ